MMQEKENNLSQFPVVSAENVSEAEDAKSKASLPDIILAKLGVNISELRKEDAEVQQKKIVEICDQALKELENPENTTGFSSEEVAEGKAFFLGQKNEIEDVLKTVRKSDRTMTTLWVLVGVIELLNDPFFKAALMGTWLLFLVRVLF